MTIVLTVASTNPGKLRELKAVLAPLGVDVRGLAEFLPAPPEPVEDADTFAGNARIKATAYALALGCACVAEDSGLEVDALAGAPGVHSAYYAGVEGTREERDARNNRKLMDAMADVPDGQRSARFVCAMCLVNARGEVLFETRGEYVGVLARSLRGANGFGYDPLLFVPELGCTSAELSPEQKNERSHRGRAARALAQFLRDNPGLFP